MIKISYLYYLLLSVVSLLGCHRDAREFPMTEEERAFAIDFFKGQVDMDNVRLFEIGSFKENKFIAQTIVNKIYFVEELDYENESRKLVLRDIFVHELVHVWQWQKHTAGLPYREYEYKLLPSQHFKQYGVEQQATIIENYYQLVFDGYDFFTLCLDCASMEKDDVARHFNRLYQEMLEFRPDN